MTLREEVVSEAENTEKWLDQRLVSSGADRLALAVAKAFLEHTAGDATPERVTYRGMPIVWEQDIETLAKVLEAIAKDLPKGVWTDEHYRTLAETAAGWCQEHGILPKPAQPKRTLKEGYSERGGHVFYEEWDEGGKRATVWRKGPVGSRQVAKCYVDKVRFNDTFILRNCVWKVVGISWREIGGPLTITAREQEAKEDAPSPDASSSPEPT